MTSANRLRVADFIARTLVARGIRHAFLVTGGGAMHLNDAFGRAPGMQYVACHHEQACAMAAESYFRMTGRLAAVNVTTGPGGTNALTGVWGAYVDSIGMIVISGQVKQETVVRHTGLPLRQLGDQELDIARLVAPVTKYAVMLTEAKSVRYHLEKALHLAVTGRPGPVWLDVPMDLQGALVDPDELEGFDPAKEPSAQAPVALEALARTALDRMASARRPVIMVGGGVRLSGSVERVLQLATRLFVPIATCWNAHDVVPDAHPLYAGRPGTIGDRAGNFAVQSSDALLVLGSRLNIRQVSYNWKSFARAAFKIMVDADEAELKKPTLRIDLPIHADLGDFLDAALRLAPPASDGRHAEWVEWCQARRARYPVVLPEYWSSEGPVNPYCFMHALFTELPPGAKVVSGDGTACVVSFQAAIIKEGTRLYTNSGCAAMGYDLPGAIGACIGLERAPVVCLAGDGSIQMNLQELQTILTHKLPIKIFVLNNQGYHSIRQTQQSYFPDNVVGCGVESGLEFPDFGKLAAAYGYPFRRISTHAGMTAAIRETLAAEGPQLCEVVLDLQQQFSPKLSSRKLPDGRMVSSPLEDLAPFLDRAELRENLLIAPEEA